MTVFGNKTEAVASELAGDNVSPIQPKKRGRPKGSKNRPKDASGNPLPPEPEKPISFNYIPDPAGIAAAAKAFGFIWMLASPFAKLTPLSEEETMKAGEALDPVLQKYVPMYNDWKYEINLVLIVVGLYQVHRIKDEAETQSKAEVVE